ncbi:MAG: VOC family protein [Actinomycetes bacterium]
MAYVSTYLNFLGQTEEAFNFYADVFNSTNPPTVMRFSSTPMAGQLPDEEKEQAMHASLEIIDGHMLMATDSLRSMGHEVRIGNNTTISLNLDSNEEADRIYGLLSQDSTERADMRQEFFGYWGSCLDRFGIRWMINVAPKND